MSQDSSLWPAAAQQFMVCGFKSLTGQNQAYHFENQTDHVAVVSLREDPEALCNTGGSQQTTANARAGYSQFGATAGVDAQHVTNLNLSMREGLRPPQNFVLIPSAKTTKFLQTKTVFMHAAFKLDEGCYKLFKVDTAITAESTISIQAKHYTQPEYVFSSWDVVGSSWDEVAYNATNRVFNPAQYMLPPSIGQACSVAAPSGLPGTYASFAIPNGPDGRPDPAAMAALMQQVAPPVYGASVPEVPYRQGYAAPAPAYFPGQQVQVYSVSSQQWILAQVMQIDAAGSVHVTYKNPAGQVIGKALSPAEQESYLSAC